MRDEGEEFVEFGRLDSGGGLRRLIGQGISLRRNPVSHCLMHHTEGPGNAPEIPPIDVHPHGLRAQRGGIALRFRFHNVFAPTPTAPIPLVS